MSLNPITTKLSRRGILSTAAAFTIVAPQTVRGTQANSKLSIGLIGSGNRGTYDAKITHADPRARITALCDKYNDRIEQAKATLQLDKIDIHLCRQWNKQPFDFGRDQFKHSAAIVTAFHLCAECRKRVNKTAHQLFSHNIIARADSIGGVSSVSADAIKN